MLMEAIGLCLQVLTLLLFPHYETQVFMCLPGAETLTSSQTFIELWWFSPVAA